MPWCPHCRREFKTGAVVCDKCKAELVDHPQQIKEKTFIKLQTVSQQEAEIVESLLKSHDITVLKNYRGAGGYVYMGRSSYGVDIFVPEAELETAQEVLEAVPDNRKD